MIYFESSPHLKLPLIFFFHLVTDLLFDLYQRVDSQFYSEKNPIEIFYSFSYLIPLLIKASYLLIIFPSFIVILSFLLTSIATIIDPCYNVNLNLTHYQVEIASKNPPSPLNYVALISILYMLFFTFLKFLFYFFELIFTNHFHHHFCWKLLNVLINILYLLIQMYFSFRFHPIATSVDSEKSTSSTLAKQSNPLHIISIKPL